jgi:hypothetical protein
MIPDELPPGCVKIFLDTDPGYNQILLSERFSWSENVERWCAGVADHDRFFTYGENINQSDCLVPSLGLDWRTTRMPVVLDLWELPNPPSLSSGGRWTTVMSWSEFAGPLVLKGVEYRSKGAEFEKLIDLPSRTDLPLCIAVGGAQAPFERLQSHGWKVIDGPQATLTPEDYRAFIARSRGEVSPAKQVYVALRTGWFSCRSACYLAAGRPVVVQDTGFSSHLPVGDGILPFDSAEAAAEACQRAEADLAHHARSAREVAATCFEAGGVLQRLVEDAYRSDT